MQISQLLEIRMSSQNGEVPGTLTITRADANPGMYQETGLNILPRPLREGIASRGYDQHSTPQGGKHESGDGDYTRWKGLLGWNSDTPCGQSKGEGM